MHQPGRPRATRLRSSQGRTSHLVAAALAVVTAAFWVVKSFWQVVSEAWAVAWPFWAVLREGGPVRGAGPHVSGRRAASGGRAAVLLFKRVVAASHQPCAPRPAHLREVWALFREVLQVLSSLTSHFWAAAAQGGVAAAGGRVSIAGRPELSMALSTHRHVSCEQAAGRVDPPRRPSREGTASQQPEHPGRSDPPKALLPIRHEAYRPPRGRGRAAGCAWCGDALNAGEGRAGEAWEATLGLEDDGEAK